MITCNKCGAQINDNEQKCAYCGWMNYNAAEDEYFKKLEKIKDSVNELQMVPEQSLGQEVKGVGKNLVKSIVIVIVALAIIFGLILIHDFMI